MAPKSSSSNTSTTINFPSFPVNPKPLKLNSLHSSDSILLIQPFFSPSLLLLWSNFLNSPSTPIKLESSPPAKRGEAHRTNSRFGIQDDLFAKELWEKTGLKQVCEENLIGNGGRTAKGLNGNIRIYKYVEGQEFGAHYDDDFYDSKTKLRSEWTLLIYLTGKEDGVEGGSTIFYPEGLSRKGKASSNTVVAPLIKGSALLHKHGADCYLHEGEKVKKGIKWVLRSDVMFG